ncbi:MAG: hypothetical protein GXP63_00445 [DPANN group archaeon]|nr:hypothetical protein [DPANN group archaeon]
MSSCKLSLYHTKINDEPYLGCAVISGDEIIKYLGFRVKRQTIDEKTESNIPCILDMMARDIDNDSEVLHIDDILNGLPQEARTNDFHQLLNQGTADILPLNEKAFSQYRTLIIGHLHKYQPMIR